MKTTLILMAFVWVAAYGQSGNLPYFVPSAENKKFERTYVLEDNESLLSFIKISFENNKYELITIPKNPDLELCRRMVGTFRSGRNEPLFFYSGKVQAIIKFDSLTFATEIENPENTQVELANYYQKKGELYLKKWHTWFKKKALPNQNNDPNIQYEWFVSPWTQANFIQGPCNDNRNLDCLCAALTYDKNTEREKSDAIADFIIERFRYNRGDTAQTNIKGLVFGKEREAVCEGYSRVYDDLLKRLNMNVNYVSGAVRTEVYDIFYSGHSHAWNQGSIDGKPYCSDITWANSTGDNWYLMDPKDMLITHFVEDDLFNKVKNLGDSTANMYDFMQQPLINPITDGGAKKIALLDKLSPIQFSKGTFVLYFKEPLIVNSVNRTELSFPFVKFSTENNTTRKVIAKSGPITKKITTKRLEVNLPEKLNNLTIDIQGIGVVHYVVFNGTSDEYYSYLIDNLDETSPYSVAMAFLACAKINNIEIFNNLKPYLSKTISFSDFMKSAKKNKINDFSFSVFNACQHSNYIFSSEKGNNDVRGYTFQYSKPYNGETCLIALKENAAQNTYGFQGFYDKKSNVSFK